jgi:hypothetical protein
MMNWTCSIRRTSTSSLGKVKDDGYAALILSTMVYEYLSGAERTRSLIITKKRIYLLQKESNARDYVVILHAIDIGWIQGIVRS